MINLRKSEILTFYSYKGGVGRSMALANIAELLFRQGKKVVIIDWDLEAPGLESYFFEGKEELEAIVSQPGLIDVLEAYKSSYSRLAALVLADTKLEPLKREKIIEDTMNLLSAQTDKEPEVRQEQIENILKASNEYHLTDSLLREITEEFQIYKSKSALNVAKVIDALNAMLIKREVFARRASPPPDRCGRSPPGGGAG